MTAPQGPTTRLIRPDAAYKASFIAAVKEFQAEERPNYMHIDLAALEADFPAYVKSQLTHEPSVLNGVPQTNYWDVDEQGYIGRLSIRHRLNAGLRVYGGHIGYDVRPSRRREGHGTRMLALSLLFVRELGIDQVMITCDETNIGSRKIIAANGGVLDKIIKLDFREVPTMHWWIDLSAT